ncbi:hypothetical protein HYPBUDRAFT_153874 [Hyphopichia burtonii NRRL Y-1933]|uniref:DUF2470 domain-containing protein n=1 Tax=Hyphopichia burtonii NRRL Y-1933 TaxID=984485 RepID=A0A1E4REK1_9ASCO|nr:hypothetical protein HYPBUDRAFT_153874 [Hyphopichia burtonii NRRL Y-1933]ODV65682.1 hypothetical protein HYPBUDRAFT_153874 [Hyphopichia burtonii NRRL Y-1933]
MSEHKERIIYHMNGDHQLSVHDYVVVYGKVPASQIAEGSAKISDISEKDVTITYKSKAIGKTEVVSLNWNEVPEDQDIKVVAFGDIKSKLISMAKYAAEKQGYSHVQIKKVLTPGVDGWIIYLLSVIVLVGCIDPKLIRRTVEHDAIFSKILPYVPQFLANFYSWSEKNFKLIAVITYAVHIFELGIVGLPRLIKYRVPLKQKLVWLVFHSLEGFPSHLRFGSLIPKE